MTNTKMKSKIFKSNEILSILSKQKTMFREVIKFDKELFSEPTFSYGKNGHSGEGFYVSEYDYAEEGSDFVKCPYKVGQKIFCKESFCDIDCEPFDRNWIDYRATPNYGGKHPAGWDQSPDDADRLKWKPAQHMKQEHSRLTLLIKEIRVEKLGEISEEDAEREGFFADNTVYYDGVSGTTATEKFIAQWNATHKKPEEKFEASPFCWVILFEVVK